MKRGVTTCWIGVASRDHVRGAVEGGFCQLGHGKLAPVGRLRRGNVLVFYSPRERLKGGEPIQAFTAAGRIRDNAPYQADAGNGFHPYRSNVDFFRSAEASIRPLLHRLSFTKGRNSWGYIFRRSVFQIESDDYWLIAEAMGLEGR